MKKSLVMGVVILMSFWLLFSLPLLADDTCKHDSVKMESSEKAESASHLAAIERPKVPAIREFHDVMKPVWHSLLPENNYAGIRELVPQFKENAEKLKKAELPLYFQHVKDKFAAKVNEISLAVNKMDTVAQGGNDSLLAIAVEDVHTAFEQMIRVLFPRMQEIEGFHLVLYTLWHEALPKGNYAGIKELMPTLQAKMDTLMAAPIPEDHKNIEKTVIEKREALKKSVDELAAACASGKDEDMKIKLTAMHEYFMALDGAFE
jgi:hypothetical protein